MKRSRLGNWLLGGLLTAGFATVWLYLAAMTGEWFMQRSMQTRTHPESRWVRVLPTGEPAVSVQSYERNVDGELRGATRYESLDGQPLIVDEKQHSDSWTCGDSQSRQTVTLSRSFSQYPQQRSLGTMELPPELWVTALASAHSTPGRSETWYFVWPRGSDTTGYFVSYDPIAKRPRVFLGTNGWNSTVPALADRFPARSAADGRLAEIIGPTGTTERQSGRESPAVAYGKTNRGHLVLSLLTPDRSRLFSIDFTEAEMATSLAVRVAREFGKDRPVSVSVSQEQRRADGSVELPSRCVLTFGDRVELTNHLWEAGRIVRLPEELRGRNFELHDTQAGFVSRTGAYQRSTNRSTSSMLWLSDNGEVTRRESYETRNETQGAEWFWCAAEGFSLMPAAPLWQAVMTPFMYGHWSEDFSAGSVNPNKDVSWSDYPRLFAHYFRTVWMEQGLWALLTCGLSGVVCASVCWQRERLRGASRAELIAWPLLVFFFGPAGLIGYWGSGRFSVVGFQW